MRSFLREAVPVLIVLCGALHIFAGAARVTDYDLDESFKIGTVRYFGYLFLRQDLSRPDWGDNYWTHTQPMLTRYVIGGWLWARGYDLDAMQPLEDYDYRLSREENRREGRVPDDALLAQARAPMVMIAAGAVVLLYLSGRLLGGAVAGLTAAALTLASPLAQEYLVQAVSEALLAFFLVLTLLLCLLGAQHGRAGGLPTRWAVAAGVALGLGLGTKLTASLSLAAVMGFGMLAAALAAWHRCPRVPGVSLGRAWEAARGWALTLVVALGVFVLSDPHLYPNPFLHIAHLFRNRAEEMLDYQRLFPQDALYDPVERARYVLGDSLIVSVPSGPREVRLGAGLAAIGAAALLVGTWRGWRRTGQVPAEGLVLLTALAYFVGVSVGLLVAWPRYLVPTLVVGSLLSGLGVSAVGRQLLAIPAALGRSGQVARRTASQL